LQHYDRWNRESPYLGGVRVVIFTLNPANSLDVLERLVHEAAIAALVAVGTGTVHQLLLTEGDQLSCLMEVLPLDGPGLQNIQAGWSGKTLW